MFLKLKNKLRDMLKWSEKWTGTDMIYLARGGFWLTSGQIISSLSALLLSVVFANLIPKETYGTYKYILSLVGILSIFTLSGIGTATTQAVAKGYDGSFAPALKTRIKWGLLGGLVSLILAGYYYFFDNQTLAISFLIVAVFLPIMDPLNNYDALLQGKKLFYVSTKYFVISQLIAIASLVATLILTKNLYLILFAYFASWTLMRFIFLKITSKKYLTNNQVDQETISYGKHLSFMSIIGTVANYLDRLLIFHYLGAPELAIYSIAIAPPEQIKGLFKNIGVLSLPKFSEKNHEEIKKTIGKKMFKMSLVLGLITIIYILLAPLIFKILFPQYLDSIFYSQIFSISLIAFIVFLPISAMQSQKMHKELYKFNSYSAIFQIILLIYFISNFGLMGAIMAKVTSRLCNLFLFFFIFYKN